MPMGFLYKVSKAHTVHWMRNVLLKGVFFTQSSTTEWFSTSHSRIMVWELPFALVPSTLYRLLNSAW